MVAHDDVIDHSDLEDLGGSAEPLGHSHVGFGGLRLTAGVIVQEDDGVGRAHDGYTEYFAGMNVAFIDGAGAYEMVSADAEFRVEAQDDEAFTLGIKEGMLLDVEPPIVGGFLGRVAVPQVFGGGALSHGDQLPFR